MCLNIDLQCVILGAVVGISEEVDLVETLGRIVVGADPVDVTGI